MKEIGRCLIENENERHHYESGYEDFNDIVEYTYYVIEVLITFRYTERSCKD